MASIIAAPVLHILTVYFGEGAPSSWKEKREKKKGKWQQKSKLLHCKLRKKIKSRETGINRKINTKSDKKFLWGNKLFHCTDLFLWQILP